MACKIELSRSCKYEKASRLGGLTTNEQIGYEPGWCSPNGTDPSMFVEGTVVEPLVENDHTEPMYTRPRQKAKSDTVYNYTRSVAQSRFPVKSRQLAAWL